MAERLNTTDDILQGLFTTVLGFTPTKPSNVQPLLDDENTEITEEDGAGGGKETQENLDNRSPTHEIQRQRRQMLSNSSNSINSNRRRTPSSRSINEVTFRQHDRGRLRRDKTSPNRISAVWSDGDVSFEMPEYSNCQDCNRLSGNMDMDTTRLTLDLDPLMEHVEEAHTNLLSTSGVLMGCHLRIIGMTCVSSVSQVERNLCKNEGVHSVLIALLAQKAEVKYDPYKTTPKCIAKLVKKMGYQCFVLEDVIHGQATATIQIKGLKSSTSVFKLEGAVSRQPGVILAAIDPNTHTGTFRYNTEITGPRTIMDIIRKEGLDCESEYNDEISFDPIQNHKELTNMWRFTFILSLFFGIPAIIVALYFFITRQLDSHQIIVLDGLNVENLILLIFATPTVFYVAKNIYIHAVKSISHCSPSVDILISVVIIVAYSFSLIMLMIAMAMGLKSSPLTLLADPPIVIMFWALFHWIQHKAKDKTMAGIKRLQSLTQSEVVLVEKSREHRESYIEKTVGINLLQKYDLVKVYPGCIVPVDGVIVQGHAHIDELHITGNCIPTEKWEGDFVMAGTTNGSEALVVQMTRITHDFIITNMIKVLEEANTSKAKTQRLTDKMSRIFPPVVITLAILVLVAWVVIGYASVKTITSSIDGQLHSEHNAIFYNALRISLCVLVIGLLPGLRTSKHMAVMVGTGLAAENGILIKGFEPLEAMQRVKHMVFSKSALMECNPQISKFAFLVPDTADSVWKQILLVVSSAEMTSPRTIAQAVQKLAYKTFGTWSPMNVSDIEENPGCGMRCKVSLPDDYDYEKDIDKTMKQYFQFMSVASGHHDPYTGEVNLVIGNREWMTSNGVTVNIKCSDWLIEHEKQGKSTALIAIDGHVVAMLCVSDTVRPEAFTLVKSLKKQGIVVTMVTGDSYNVAVSIANQLGIEHTYAEALPDTKADIVAKCQGIFSRSDRVVMVGSDTDESGAIEIAHTGFLIGRESDILFDATNIVFIGAKLDNIIEIINLSKKVMGRIRMNSVFMLVYNILAIPLAAGVLFPLGVVLQPWMGAGIMSIANLICIASSLFINWWQLQRKFTKPTNGATTHSKTSEYKYQLVKSNEEPEKDQNVNENNIQQHTDIESANNYRNKQYVEPAICILENELISEEDQSTLATADTNHERASLIQADNNTANGTTRPCNDRGIRKKYGPVSSSQLKQASTSSYKRKHAADNRPNKDEKAKKVETAELKLNDAQKGNKMPHISNTQPNYLSVVPFGVPNEEENALNENSVLHLGEKNSEAPEMYMYEIGEVEEDVLPRREKVQHSFSHESLGHLDQTFCQLKVFESPVNKSQNEPPSEESADSSNALFPRREKDHHSVSIESLGHIDKSFSKLPVFKSHTARSTPTPINKDSMVNDGCTSVLPRTEKDRHTLSQESLGHVDSKHSSVRQYTPQKCSPSKGIDDEVPIGGLPRKEKEKYFHSMQSLGHFDQSASPHLVFNTHPVLERTTSEPSVSITIDSNEDCFKEAMQPISDFSGTSSQSPVKTPTTAQNSSGSNFPRSKPPPVSLPRCEKDRHSYSLESLGHIQVPKDSKGPLFTPATNTNSRNLKLRELEILFSAENSASHIYCTPRDIHEKEESRDIPIRPSYQRKQKKRRFAPRRRTFPSRSGNFNEIPDLVKSEKRPSEAEG